MKRSILAILALVVTASCGDGTDPDVNASGSVAFSYNGGSLLAAGSYNATGSLPANPNDQDNRTWAAGYRDPDNNNNFGVVATVARSNRFDLAVIYFDRSNTGTSNISVDCNFSETETCPGMILWYNLSESTTATGEVLCGLESGTMTLATLSSTRATGTFSGTGTCVGDDFTTETTFTVTNGTFDVPIVSDVGSGLMMRSRR